MAGEFLWEISRVTLTDYYLKLHLIKTLFGPNLTLTGPNANKPPPKRVETSRSSGELIKNQFRTLFTSGRKQAGALLLFPGSSAKGVEVNLFSPQLGRI